MGPKKSTATKRSRPSSSTNYDHSRFISAEAAARFQSSITRRSGIAERGFELVADNARTQIFYNTIRERGWQIFCRPPKAAAMTVVREFFANAQESPTAHKAFVRGKEVKYDSATINSLFRFDYNPTGPDDVDLLLNNEAHIPMITEAICINGRTTWTMARETHAHFPSKDLHPQLRVWHHFICARLVPTKHLSEVTKERAALLYAILTGQRINVGRWIQHNLNSAVGQGSGGIPHPTLLTELIASQGIPTEGTEILQPKGPLNQKGIERILIHDIREEVTGASSSRARAPRPAQASQTSPTIADLARAVERHGAQLHGMRNWMAAKAAYDRSMGEAMCARLDALVMNSGVDPSTMPQMPTYPETLTRPWEPEEPPYEEEDEEATETEDE